MKLFQYWDTGSPPDEVAGWIEGFRRLNPDATHVLFDREQASWFIGKHVGERERRAFDAIAVPSMQSDYFRYCAIWAKGGTYVDADFQCLVPLGDWMRDILHSFAFEWDGHLVAGLFMARRPGHAFIRACLDLATANIEARGGKNAYMAAGPGVMNAIRLLADPTSRPEVERGFDNVWGREWRFQEILDRAAREIPITDAIRADLSAMSVMNVYTSHEWLATPVPAYKRTERHWLRWKGSLYRDEA